MNISKLKEGRNEEKKSKNMSKQKGLRGEYF